MWLTVCSYTCSFCFSQKLRVGAVITSRDSYRKRQFGIQKAVLLFFLGWILALTINELKIILKKSENKLGRLKHLCYICSIK